MHRYCTEMKCKFGTKRSVPLSELSKRVYKRKASLVRFGRVLFTFTLVLNSSRAVRTHHRYSQLAGRNWGHRQEEKLVHS